MTHDVNHHTADGVPMPLTEGDRVLLQDGQIATILGFKGELVKVRQLSDGNAVWIHERYIVKVLG